MPGEVVGDVSESDLRRVQIRETIRSHFEKEKELYNRGIKTLSLFFIDEVAKYRKYDQDGNEINSVYGEIFEQEYTDILNEQLTLFDTPYEQYLRGIDTHKTHAGYFSIDKKGRKVDSATKRGSDESDDISAYDLILKDKEKLLSFDSPVRFIFSHSALREGWDNPNVFQICTLKHGGSSPVQKRQEVGRGLRLCVNQNGDRMDIGMLGSQVQQINKLTVIASDGYKDFVDDLQRGIREDLYERPTKATPEYFTGKTIFSGGKAVTVSEKQGHDIYHYLIRNEYIDNDGHVTDSYRAALANGAPAPVPESCKDISDGVHTLIIREDLYERPTEATPEYFTGKTIFSGGKAVTVSEKQGHDIYHYLIRNEYIDNDGHVTDSYRAALANGAPEPVPESCKDISDGVHALIQSIFDEHALDDMIENGHKTKIQENALNDNFYKKEFQELWNSINHKYAYTVEFDSGELIRKAAAHIDDKMFVSEIQYIVKKGTQGEDGTFTPRNTRTGTLKHSQGSLVPYDLVGKIAEGAKLTRRSAAKILAGIKPSVFEMFKKNPEEFITKAVRLINEQKATVIVEQITYSQTDGAYDSGIFTAEKNSDYTRAYRARKNVQDYVFADGYAKDGQSVERRFAEDMDRAAEVCVYAKLPKGFSIPTPVGHYSPDWAIAFNKGTVKHIFFIAETKGTMDSLNLRPVEQAKIKCAKKLFNELSAADVVYHDVTNYQDLMSIMNSL